MVTNKPYAFCAWRMLSELLCLVAFSCYLPIHAWAHNPHTPFSLCSLSLCLVISLLPLASSSPELPPPLFWCLWSWHEKRKWQQVCLWLFLEWPRLTENNFLEWLCHRGGIARLCLTPARWGCLMLNGHEIYLVLSTLWGWVYRRFLSCWKGWRPCIELRNWVCWKKS